MANRRKGKNDNKKNMKGSNSKHKNGLFIIVGLAILLLITLLISKKIMISNEENNDISNIKDTNSKPDDFLQTTINGNNSTTSLANITFPEDHAFHSNFKNEWWYVNLMVRSTSTSSPKTTRDTYYLISFSKINNQYYGLLTSRYEDENKKFKQETHYPATGSAKIKNSKLVITFSFKINNKNYKLTLAEQNVLRNGAKNYILSGTTPEIGTINFVLKERTVNKSGSNTPLLWGCDGKISVFSATGKEDTYYYSIPDLDVTGNFIDIDNTSRKVIEGKAWMDHQWFNSFPSDDWKGHYWTSQYLTNRRDFSGSHVAIGAVTQIFKNGPRNSYWVKRNSNGTNECGSNVQITPGSYYSNGYPASLNITLKDNNNKLVYSGKMGSFSSNQIFITPRIPNSPIQLKFFEPAAYITGKIKNINYTGLGFFETSLKNK